MRSYCLDCVIKHLGQAMVTQQEAMLGYPEHILLTIGHLAEASEEIIGVSSNLSSEIRQWRLSVIEDSSTEVPYFDIYKKVLKLIEEYGCGDCKKADDDFRKRIEKAKKSD